MYSENRTRHGEVGLREKNGKIQIRFPRSLFNGKRKELSTGLTATSKNYTIAQQKVEAINHDIALGQFDASLERYKPQGKQKTYQDKVTQLYPSANLVEIYEKYMDYRKAREKEPTYLERVQTILPKLQESGVTNINNALELHDFLIENDNSEGMTKRVLKQVRTAYQWAIDKGMIKGDVDQYTKLIKDLKHQFERDPNPNPFSEWEKEAILEAFQTHHLVNGGYSLSHYYPLVKFLFMTGCRPNEAVGLTWEDVDFRANKITFDGGITYKAGKFIDSKGKGSKTNKKRQFPMNTELSKFLQSLPKHPSTSLVFSSRNGKPINYNNFGSRVWKKVVSELNLNRKTTPYNCRDTFISEQITKGVSPMVVGKWCDTSSSTIERYYFGSISNILPV